MSTTVYGKITVIKRNGNSGSQYPVTSSCCTFGRDADCEIRIQLPTVSSQECKLESDENGSFVLSKVNEGGEIKVNDETVDTTATINHNDVLTVAGRSFRFEYPPKFIGRRRSSTNALQANIKSANSPRTRNGGTPKPGIENGGTPLADRGGMVTPRAKRKSVEPSVLRNMQQQDLISFETPPKPICAAKTPQPKRESVSSSKPKSKSTGGQFWDLSVTQLRDEILETPEATQERGSIQKVEQRSTNAPAKATAAPEDDKATQELVAIDTPKEKRKSVRTPKSAVKTVVKGNANPAADRDPKLLSYEESPLLIPNTPRVGVAKVANEVTDTTPPHRRKSVAKVHRLMQEKQAEFDSGLESGVDMAGSSSQTVHVDTPRPRRKSGVDLSTPVSEQSVDPLTSQMTHGAREENMGAENETSLPQMKTLGARRRSIKTPVSVAKGKVLKSGHAEIPTRADNEHEFQITKTPKLQEMEYSREPDLEKADVFGPQTKVYSNKRRSVQTPQRQSIGMLTTPKALEPKTPNVKLDDTVPIGQKTPVTPIDNTEDAGDEDVSAATYVKSKRRSVRTPKSRLSGAPSAFMAYKSDAEAKLDDTVPIADQDYGLVVEEDSAMLVPETVLNEKPAEDVKSNRNIVPKSRRSSTASANLVPGRALETNLDSMSPAQATKDGNQAHKQSTRKSISTPKSGRSSVIGAGTPKATQPKLSETTQIEGDEMNAEAEDMLQQGAATADETGSKRRSIRTPKSRRSIIVRAGTPKGIRPELADTALIEGNQMNGKVEDMPQPDATADETGSKRKSIRTPKSRRSSIVRAGTLKGIQPELSDTTQIEGDEMNAEAEDMPQPDATADETGSKRKSIRTPKSRRSSIVRAGTPKGIQPELSDTAPTEGDEMNAEAEDMLQPDATADETGSKRKSIRTPKSGRSSIASIGSPEGIQAELSETTQTEGDEMDVEEAEIMQQSGATADQAGPKRSSRTSESRRSNGAEVVTALDDTVSVNDLVLTIAGQDTNVVVLVETQDDDVTEEVQNRESISTPKAGWISNAPASPNVLETSLHDTAPIEDIEQAMREDGGSETPANLSLFINESGDELLATSPGAFSKTPEPKRRQSSFFHLGTSGTTPESKKTTLVTTPIPRPSTPKMTPTPVATTKKSTPISRQGTPRITPKGTPNIIATPGYRIIPASKRGTPRATPRSSASNLKTPKSARSKVSTPRSTSVEVGTLVAAFDDILSTPEISLSSTGRSGTGSATRKTLKSPRADTPRLNLAAARPHTERKRLKTSSLTGIPWVPQSERRPRRVANKFTSSATPNPATSRSYLKGAPLPQSKVLQRVKSQARRVSFGPQLSPEQFVASLPPNTPVKKGAIPIQPLEVAIEEPSPKAPKSATKQRKKTPSRRSLRRSRGVGRKSGVLLWSEIVRKNAEKQPETTADAIKQDTKPAPKRRKVIPKTPEQRRAMRHVDSPATIYIGRATRKRRSSAVMPTLNLSCSDDSFEDSFTDSEANTSIGEGNVTGSSNIDGIVGSSEAMGIPRTSKEEEVTDDFGTRRLLKTPKVKNQAVTEHFGTKRLLKTPVVKIKNMAVDQHFGTKRLLQTPREKSKNPPVEDHFGTKRLLTTPKAAEKYDEVTEKFGTKRLLRTPKVKVRYEAVDKHLGLKRLLQTPKEKTTYQPIKEHFGTKRLLTTPKRIEKGQEVTEHFGTKRLLQTPREKVTTAPVEDEFSLEVLFASEEEETHIEGLGEDKDTSSITKQELNHSPKPAGKQTESQKEEEIEKFPTVEITEEQAPSKETVPVVAEPENPARGKRQTRGRRAVTKVESNTAQAKKPAVRTRETRKRQRPKAEENSAKSAKTKDAPPTETVTTTRATRGNRTKKAIIASTGETPDNVPEPAEILSSSTRGRSSKSSVKKVAFEEQAPPEKEAPVRQTRGKRATRKTLAVTDAQQEARVSPDEPLVVAGKEASGIQSEPSTQAAAAVRKTTNRSTRAGRGQKKEAEKIALVPALKDDAPDQVPELKTEETQSVVEAPTKRSTRSRKAPKALAEFEVPSAESAPKIQAPDVPARRTTRGKKPTEQKVPTPPTAPETPSKPATRRGRKEPKATGSVETKAPTNRPTRSRKPAANVDENDAKEVAPTSERPTRSRGLPIKLLEAIPEEPAQLRKRKRGAKEPAEMTNPQPSKKRGKAPKESSSAERTNKADAEDAAVSKLPKTPKKRGKALKERDNPEKCNEADAKDAAVSEINEKNLKKRGKAPKERGNAEELKEADAKNAAISELPKTSTKRGTRSSKAKKNTNASKEPTAPPKRSTRKRKRSHEEAAALEIKTTRSTRAAKTSAKEKVPAKKAEAAPIRKSSRSRRK